MLDGRSERSELIFFFCGGRSERSELFVVDYSIKFIKEGEG